MQTILLVDFRDIVSKSGIMAIEDFHTDNRKKANGKKTENRND